MKRFDEYLFNNSDVGVTALEVFELRLQIIADLFACDINKDVYLTVSICANDHEPYVKVINGVAQGTLDLDNV